MFFWLSQVLFTVSSICTKLSVLLFYRRMMMDTLDRRWIYALWVALGFTISYGIAILIGHFFICQPLEALWNIMTPGFDKSFTCIDSAAFTLASGVLGTVSDGYAVALPCLMLRNYDLDASRRQRVALNVVFGLGLLVSGCGVARTYWLWKTNHTLGPTWNNFELLAWTIAECQLGVICACAPAWRVFFRRYLRDNLRRRFGSALGSYSQDQSKEVAMVTTATTEHDTRSYVDLEDLAVDAAGRIVPAHTLRGPTAARRGNDQRSGSKGGSCTTTTTDDTRSSIGVQNLETDAADGVHPAYTTNEENGEWKGNGHAANGSDEKCPTPTISNTEQFEAYAIARLSLLSKHKYPTLVQVPAPKTDEATGSRQKCKDKYAV
ncbi:uncharacterized protein RCC_00556 [Ramularia collo-cygni]|uniref:Rhodopsin domain-containing protein n=1 Tax=Ramularia collo-cygni TaxID=112498 RepID=A0A2D3UQQ3_9PEZI|nr:uncharacterized protein RCC_00556 [Ramularia collo-cygni]CZT14580.1 uncharacterized protein RCC_00556 [Ramularia collo-cygni]